MYLGEGGTTRCLKWFSILSIWFGRKTQGKKKICTNFATWCKGAIAVICKVANILANLETKLWTKIPTNSLVQMKGNLSQIYPIPIPSQKRELYMRVKIYLPICFPNLNKICTSWCKSIFSSCESFCAKATKILIFNLFLL